MTAENNRLQPEDRPAHDWYRFVLSFPPHLVRHCIGLLGVDASRRVLDPFCGTGTTIVECKKRGIPSVGIEANPVACFASRVKVDWSVEPDLLLDHARDLAERAMDKLESDGTPDVHLPLFRGGDPPRVPLRTLPSEAAALLLRNSVSPLPLHKTLVLMDTLANAADERFEGHEKLALAKALVCSVSNLNFGPEVGVGKPKHDAAVIAPWLAAVCTMAQDIRALRPHAGVPAQIHQADARQIHGLLAPGSIDVVITSPPYPNEKDYTRTTRLELVLLGFVRSKGDLRALKRTMVRSNTRGVYAGDDDDLWVDKIPQIQRLAEEIEARRAEMGKTSGFERLYARVTRLYFGGMAKHLADLRLALRPGARLAYVVGDQASYLRVMIRTGQVLARIASSLGYEVIGIELFRTRLATATREQLREEILLLRWPGQPGIVGGISRDRQ